MRIIVEVIFGGMFHASESLGRNEFSGVIIKAIYY
jgi:hypothetical protein